MKTWVFGAIVAAVPTVLSLVACGTDTRVYVMGSGAANAGSTGAGTETTASASGGTHVSSSSSSGTSSSGSSTGGSSGVGGSSAGSCAAPKTISDCGTCANQNDCGSCAAMLDLDGLAAYNDFANCIDCTACFDTCGGSTTVGQPGGCSGPPATLDSCDQGQPGTMGCNLCIPCAEMFTCSIQYQECTANAQCVDLMNNLASTCDPLPM